MTLPVEVNPLLMGGGGYRIAKSLRFRASASAYLSRTPGSVGDRQKWTYSAWVKIGTMDQWSGLLNAGSSGNQFALYLYTDGTLYAQDRQSGVNNIVVQTQQVFHDPSSWYHIVLSINTTDATASNRVKIYVNGSLITNLISPTYPSQNFTTVINDNGYQHNIGLEYQFGSTSPHYFDGYLAEVNFIDGQALDASYFGETDPVNGVWRPKKYTGTYGTNGFYLDFNDTSSTTALGYDAAGSNDWTVNNISLASDATYDGMIDTPTPYADGGNGVGNYATLNPLKVGPYQTISEANLRIYSSGSSITNQCIATILPKSGKWYFENTVITNVSNAQFGVATPNASTSTYPGGDAYSWGIVVYAGYVDTYYNGTNTTSNAISGITATGTFGVAYDADAGKMWITDQNGTWVLSGSPSTGANPIISSITTTDGLGPSIGHYSIGSKTTDQAVNFGQRPFTYTPPSGFKALNTQNLPEGTITTSGSFTGNGSTDGPFIYLNGVPTAMTINSNSVTFGTHADKLANGFKVRSSSSSYNVSGSNTYSITTTGAKLKYANAQGNP